MIGLLSSNKHNRIWNDKGGEFQPLCTPKAKNSPHSDYRTLRGTRDGLRRPKKLKDPQLNSVLTWPFTIILIRSWFLIFYWNLYSNTNFYLRVLRSPPSPSIALNTPEFHTMLWCLLRYSVSFPGQHGKLSIEHMKVTRIYFRSQGCRECSSAE